MTKIKILRPLILLAIIFSYVLFPAASSALGGNGLRISPVITNTTISPGKSGIVDVTITNVQTVSATLQAIINDFTASSDESGNPSILVNPNSYAPSHSLKRFVDPIKDTINLTPGESVIVPVTIKVPANAAGGGYYGLVRFAPASTTLQSGKNLSLAGSVGSLIILTVPGNIVNDLRIASFNVQTGNTAKTIFYSSKNINAVVRFSNQGNIQEQPFGRIILKKGSKQLSSVEINNTTPRGNVLPGSVRKFSIPLKGVGSFGKYTVEGNFGYGSNGQLLSAQTSFYVIPLTLIILVIILLIVILALIFVLPKAIRSYNKKVIARATRKN
jgi:hypothetical protein